MKKNKQLQFAEALVEHLKDDHGGQLVGVLGKQIRRGVKVIVRQNEHII